VDSDEVDGHTSHIGSGGHGLESGHGHHGTPPSSRTGTPRHGKLPFTGRSLVITVLSSTAAVLTGTLLILLASARKKRKARL
jgi:hypothetical protein